MSFPNQKVQIEKCRIRQAQKGRRLTVIAVMLVILVILVIRLTHQLSRPSVCRRCLKISPISHVRETKPKGTTLIWVMFREQLQQQTENEMRENSSWRMYSLFSFSFLFISFAQCPAIKIPKNTDISDTASHKDLRPVQWDAHG